MLLPTHTQEAVPLGCISALSWLWWREPRVQLSEVGQLRVSLMSALILPPWKLHVCAVLALVEESPIRHSPDLDTTPILPGVWIYPGMMPILHSPGLIMPGQLGPMSRVRDWAAMCLFTLTMSI